MERLPNKYQFGKFLEQKMSKAPVWGFPPDLRVEKYLILSNETPNVWHIDKRVWEQIWGLGGTGINEKLAILDTGVNSHRNLPQPIYERSMIRGESPRDGNFHGTHCAGTALGRDGIGIAFEAELINIKVLSNRGSGGSDGIAQGIRIAVDEGATIISMSLGGPDPYPPTEEALEYAHDNDVLVVAAAGNDGQRGNRDTTGWPGRYETTLCIGSHAQNGGISEFSSAGKRVDMVFPGSQIVSCSNENQNGYKTSSGTSMATPYAGGVSACFRSWMMRKGYPRLGGARQWREFLAKYAIDKGSPGRDSIYGEGVVDYTKLIELMLSGKLNYV